MRILLVEDHEVVRDGLRTLLESQPDVHVVAEAVDGRMAIEQAEQWMPDVIVMDVAMPNLNGIEATRQIISEHSAAKVVMLSSHTSQQVLRESLKAGAAAFVPKEAAFEELLNAIQAASENRVYLSPRVASLFVDDYLHGQTNGHHSAAYHSLTPREREVLQLIAEGKSTKEVAFALYVSVKTVETHRRQIMDKLNVSSVAELTKYAIREGLTSLEF